MESAIDLWSDKTALKEFVKKAGVEAQKNPDKSWITTTAFAFVTYSEKLGWKAGRVLQFLYEKKKVPLNQLAKSLKDGGGIEKILKTAAKEDPRRDKASAPKETTKSKAMRHSGTRKNKFDPDERNASIERSVEKSGGNDKLVYVLMPMLIRLSDRHMLNELPAKAGIKILATRTNRNGAQIEVTRVKELKPNVPNAEEVSSDWA
jgi:hypothetical protein